MPRKPEGDRPARRPLVDEQLADQLLGGAQAEGAGVLGSDGLLSQMTKAVLERAPTEEMAGHLGYEKHDPGRERLGQQPQWDHGDAADLPQGAPAPRRPAALHRRRRAPLHLLCQ